MKFTWWTVLVGALLVGFCQAQSMPTCASNCLAQFLKQSSCSATDAACICADTTLMTNVGDCTLANCTIIEALAAKNATMTLCKEPIRDRSHVATIATAVSGSLALAFVLLRCYECAFQKEFRWADICAILAMVFSIPMDVFEFYMKSSGFGKDIWTLSASQITDVVKYTWVTQVSYIPAIILTKVAIVLLFIRVFPDNFFQKLCYGTIVHCILFMVSTTIAAILACVPVSYAWTNWSGEGHGVCYNNNAFWWAHSAINIATDLWILALPIPQLLKLQLGRKKKIYLILMFSVGIVITVISIIRFSGLVTYSTTSNPTYNNVMVATYSVIECNVSICCCCMPNLLAFLRRVAPGMFGSTNRSRDYNSRTYAKSKSGGFPTNAIQKSVTHSVSYMPRSGDSDVVELMDVEENKVETVDRYHKW